MKIFRAYPVSIQTNKTEAKHTITKNSNTTARRATCASSIIGTPGVVRELFRMDSWTPGTGRPAVDTEWWMALDRQCAKVFLECNSCEIVLLRFQWRFNGFFLFLCLCCTCVYFRVFSIYKVQLIVHVGPTPSKFAIFCSWVIVWRILRQILFAELVLLWTDHTDFFFLRNCIKPSTPQVMGVPQTKEQPRAGMALNIEQLQRLSFWRGELKYSRKQQTVWKKKYFLLLRKVWNSEVSECMLLVV